MPPFDHLHPAVVHFAIALLALAPVLLLLALAWKAQRRGLLSAGLLLLLAGAAASLLAQATGQAAERFARATPELRAALQVHEAAGLWPARMALAAILPALAAWLLPVLRTAVRPGRLEAGLLAIALLLSLLAGLSALRTGHLGGTMVHVLGTHAIRSPAM